MDKEKKKRFSKTNNMKWSFIITEDLEKIRIKSVANWKSIYDPLHCKIIHEELSVSCCRLLYIILLKKPTSEQTTEILWKSQGAIMI